MPNAVLTKVAAGGSAEDFDRAAEDGSEKWSGQEGVYFSETSEEAQDSRGATRVIRRSVLAPADLPIDFSEGDTITFERTDGSEVSEAIERTQRTEFPGAPGVVRLHLEDG